MAPAAAGMQLRPMGAAIAAEIASERRDLDSVHSVRVWAADEKASFKPRMRIHSKCLARSVK